MATTASSPVKLARIRFISFLVRGLLRPRRAGCFRGVRRDEIHQRRRQTVVGLQPELADPRAPRPPPRPGGGRRARPAPIGAGAAPLSMIDDTKAANSGGDQPDSGDSSVWMKSS